MNPGVSQVSLILSCCWLIVSNGNAISLVLKLNWPKKVLLLRLNKKDLIFEDAKVIDIFCKILPDTDDFMNRLIIVHMSLDKAQ